MSGVTPPRDTTIDYLSPGAGPPSWKFPWRPVVIAVFAIFAIFILFCSGLPFPIVGGASRDLAKRLNNQIGVTLPQSAVVEHGARIAYVDPSYYFVVRVAPADLQPFINAIRNKTANSGLQDRNRFVLVGPPPPAWFDVNSVVDLVTFDVHTGDVWRFGYSPSTGKIYIEWMSF